MFARERKKRLTKIPEKYNCLNKVYNDWTVIDKASSINNKRAWLCRCVCGKEKVVLGIYLRRGNSKSCGCRARRVGVIKRRKCSNEEVKEIVGEQSPETIH